MSEKLRIRCLATRIPGLDNLLGGGLPEFSFNLIAARREDEGMIIGGTYPGYKGIMSGRPTVKITISTGRNGQE